LDLLVTGFEPFGEEAINPSALAAELVQVPGVKKQVLILPTEFNRCTIPVIAAIRQYQPKWVVMLGQASGRTQVTPERLAVNLDDASIPDNAGQQPQEQQISSNAPVAYFSTLPIRDMVVAMRAEGVPAQISNTAGTYVCNHLFYKVMDFLVSSGQQTRAGFIHIPLLPNQVLKDTRPSMELGLCCRGLEAALAEMIKH